MGNQHPAAISRENARDGWEAEIIRLAQREEQAAKRRAALRRLGKQPLRPIVH